MSTKTVSVVLPVRNGEKYLHSAIASIQNQTLTSFELIVVDDGSTDKTAQILKRLAARDSRIRVAHLSPNGLVSALNVGLEMATADWIARMDADDLAFPTRLSKQLKWISKVDDVVALGTFVEEIDPAGWSLGVSELPQIHSEIESMLFAGIGGAICHPSAMFAKSAIRQVGGYCEDALYCEDLDLYLKLGEVGVLSNLPEVLLKYRKHPGALNVVRRTEMSQALQRVLVRVGERRNSEIPHLASKIVALDHHPSFHRECGSAALSRGKRVTALKHALMLFWGEPSAKSSRSFVKYVIIGCLRR